MGWMHILILESVHNELQKSLQWQETCYNLFQWFSTFLTFSLFFTLSDVFIGGRGRGSLYIYLSNKTLFKAVLLICTGASTYSTAYNTDTQHFPGSLWKHYWRGQNPTFQIKTTLGAFLHCTHLVQTYHRCSVCSPHIALSVLFLVGTQCLF